MCQKNIGSVYKSEHSESLIYFYTDEIYQMISTHHINYNLEK